MARTKTPPIIEGSHRVVTERVRPRREPIFNHPRNAVPLLVLITVRLLSVLATRHH